jgi:hypothetical protein
MDAVGMMLDGFSSIEVFLAHVNTNSISARPAIYSFLSSSYWNDVKIVSW